MCMPTDLKMSIDVEPDESFDVEHCNPNYDPQKMKKKPSSVAAGCSASKNKASTEALAKNKAEGIHIEETMHHLQKTCGRLNLKITSSFHSTELNLWSPDLNKTKNLVKQSQCGCSETAAVAYWYW